MEELREALAVNDDPPSDAQPGKLPEPTGATWQPPGGGTEPPEPPDLTAQRLRVVVAAWQDLFLRTRRLLAHPGIAPAAKQRLLADAIREAWLMQSDRIFPACTFRQALRHQVWPILAESQHYEAAEKQLACWRRAHHRFTRLWSQERRRQREAR